MPPAEEYARQTQPIVVSAHTHGSAAGPPNASAAFPLKCVVFGCDVACHRRHGSSCLVLTVFVCLTLHHHFHIHLQIGGDKSHRLPQELRLDLLAPPLLPIHRAESSSQVCSQLLVAQALCTSPRPSPCPPAPVHVPQPLCTSPSPCARPPAPVRVPQALCTSPSPCARPPGAVCVPQPLCASPRPCEHPPAPVCVPQPMCTLEMIRYIFNAVAYVKMMRERWSQSPFERL